ncbi:MAG TPA: iron-containing redox enzyme family protein [Solirubrobacteraceae bacterium]|nr:iron-containing redox enzyme family protein [Solirubrobacteraceae bacterium]
MDFWAAVQTRADRWDVLRHPFYLRWSAGELEPAELSFYAGQYAHAVGAVASATRHAARQAPPSMRGELLEHALEEEAHVELWGSFADRVGAKGPAPAVPETAECVSAWSRPERELLPTLVALHAIESAQPAISATKLEGLRLHYGIDESPATDYFTVHAVRDVEHAAQTRRLVSGARAAADAADPVDDTALLDEVAHVLCANWRLLDGVQRSRPLTA